jgi:TPR repeat protein
MYEFGLGVEANPLQAYLHYSLAVAAGVANAANSRDRLAEQLGSAELPEAQRAAASLAERPAAGGP